MHMKASVPMLKSHIQYLHSLFKSVASLTCVQHLVDKALYEAGGDLVVGEEKRKAGVSHLPQSQPLLALLIHTVTFQHPLKHLQKCTHKTSVNMSQHSIEAPKKIYNYKISFHL